MNDIINELVTAKENLKKELNNFSKEKEVELLTLKASLEKDFQAILEGKTIILREFSNEQVNSMKDLAVQALLAINDTAVDKEKELKLLENYINNLLLQTNDSLEQKINQAVNNFYNDMETTKNEIFQNILNNINTFKLDIDKKCENWLKQIEFSSNEGLRQLNVKENEAIKFIENAEKTALSNINNLNLQLEKEIKEKFNNIEQTILLELGKALNNIKEQTRISLTKLENESTKFTLQINGIIDTFNINLNKVLTEQQQLLSTFIEEQRQAMIQIKDQMIAEFNTTTSNLSPRVTFLETELKKINDTKSDITHRHYGYATKFELDEAILNNKSSPYEKNIDSLVNSKKYKLGDVVEVAGYYNPGDGGHKRIAQNSNDGSGVKGQGAIWWNLVKSTIVDIKHFGAKGDGITDNTEIFTKALSYLNKYSTLYVSSGIYKGNFIFQHHQIIGNGDTTFIANDKTKPIITLLDPSGWDYQLLRDFKIDGQNSAEVLVQFGVTFEERYSGRWLFKNISFKNATVIGVKKPSGNIGNHFEECDFNNNPIHFYACNHSGKMMHVGCDTFYKCHLTGATKAVWYYKETNGIGKNEGGQIVIKDCIAEGNSTGAVFIADNFGAGTVPIIIENLWLEVNSTKPQNMVEINGKQYKAREFHIEDVQRIKISGTYIHSSFVKNSNLSIDSCEISDNYTSLSYNTFGEGVQLENRNSNINITNSFTRCGWGIADNDTTPITVKNHLFSPKYVIGAYLGYFSTQANDIYIKNYRNCIPLYINKQDCIDKRLRFEGERITCKEVYDTDLKNNCLEYEGVMEGGWTHRVFCDTFRNHLNKYAVFSFSIKAINLVPNSDLKITGGSGDLGKIVFKKAGEWCHFRMCFFVDPEAYSEHGNIGFWFENSPFGFKFRLKNIQFLFFNTLGEANSFVDSGLFLDVDIDSKDTTTINYERFGIGNSKINVSALINYHKKALTWVGGSEPYGQMQVIPYTDEDTNEVLNKYKIPEGNNYYFRPFEFRPEDDGKWCLIRVELKFIKLESDQTIHLYGGSGNDKSGIIKAKANTIGAWKTYHTLTKIREDMSTHPFNVGFSLFSLPVLTEFAVRSYTMALFDTREEALKIIDDNLILHSTGAETPPPPPPPEKTNPLPILRFVGDFTGISKDTKVTVGVELEDEYGVKVYENKKASLKWQGSSTLAFPKKNYSISLFEEDGTTKYNIKPFSDVPASNSYHLKADYIDVTHIRNLGYANYIKSLYKNVLPNSARGVMDGFPVLVYENGVKKGIYNFSTKQGGDVYGLLKSDPNNLMFRSGWCEHDYVRETSAGSFDILATDTTETAVPTQWEERFPETYSAGNMAKLNRLIQWHIDCKNNIVKYRNEVNSYWNLDYLIDYYIYLHALGMTDSGSNNMNIVTYDGLIWYPTFYDMDSTGGLSSGGYSKVPTDVKFCSDYCISRNTLYWELLVEAFQERISARYWELRNNGMSNQNIINFFTKYAEKIPMSEIQADIAMYDGIMVKDADLTFMNNWHTARLNYADKEEIFNYVKPTDVIVSGLSVEVGKQKQITYTQVPSNSSKELYTYTSSDTKIATVNSKGLVVGVALGSATITMTSVKYPIQKTINVTVQEVGTGNDPILTNLYTWIDAKDLTIGKTLNDKSGNGNHARLVDERTDTVHPSGYINLNNTTVANHITFEKNIMSELGVNWTLQISFKKLSSNSTNVYLLCQHMPSATDRFAIMVDEAKKFGFFKAPNLKMSNLVVPINSQDLTIITITKEGSTLTFYKDNQKEVVTLEANFSNTYLNTEFVVGYPNVSDYNLQMDFASLRIYHNKCLTEAEIQKNIDYEKNIVR